MCEALKRDGISKVFFCVQSLDAPPSKDEFKFRMGCTAKPVRQRVVFHPWIRPVVNNLTHKMVSQMLQRNQGNRLLAKAEGMLRFYLEGKRPPEQQNLPECLADCKSELAKAAFS